MEVKVESNADSVVFDDDLLVKAYDDSIKMPREELARRIALATNKQKQQSDTCSSPSLNAEEPKASYKVGDYVRATYDVDGIDYEGKITTINETEQSCLLTYIGYENQQELALCDLLPSWGKKARRDQFVTAKGEPASADTPTNSTKRNEVKKKSKKSRYVVPPPPPMPPMVNNGRGDEDSEHLTAMLMSWYMSGYYTGVYQGMKMVREKSKAKK